jgi:hypothetical protein
LTGKCLGHETQIRTFRGWDPPRFSDGHTACKCRKASAR